MVQVREGLGPRNTRHLLGPFLDQHTFSFFASRCDDGSFLHFRVVVLSDVFCVYLEAFYE